jgi:MFS family permease
VARERLPAATALYGAVTDLGYVAGPALAAAAFVVVGPETVLAINAVTFGLSALLLSRLAFGAVAEAPDMGEIPPGLLRAAREGLVETARFRGLRVLLLASGIALYFGGYFNLGEVLFATEELAAGNVGYSVLVTVYGVGFISGSLAGGRGGAIHELKRRYLAGVFLMGCGFIAGGLSPTLALALVPFALGGFGNGLMLVYERLLIQAVVPESLSGRVFGVKDSLTAWAWAAAFLTGAAVLALLGTRETIVLAGCGVLFTWAVSALFLRRAWNARRPDGEDLAGGPGGRVGGEGPAGEESPHLVGTRDETLAALDDSR